MALITYWPLDETSGTTVNDVEDGRDGTNNGATVGVSGATDKTDTAYSFDGTDDFIDIGASAISPPWTATMWTNISQSGSYTIPLDDVDVGYSLRLEQYETTGQYGISEYNVGDYTFSVNTVFDSWAFVAFVGTSSDTTLYLNGSDTSDTISQVIDCPLNRISGTQRDTLVGWVDGKLDEIRIYDHALTASEVQSLYDSYFIPAPSNIQFNDTQTEDELTLDWDEVTEATGYYIYRAQSSGSTTSDYTQVADVSSPPYTDTGLEDGERYYYRVTSEY